MNVRGQRYKKNNKIKRRVGERKYREEDWEKNKMKLIEKKLN